MVSSATIPGNLLYQEMFIPVRAFACNKECVLGRLISDIIGHLLLLSNIYQLLQAASSLYAHSKQMIGGDSG